MVILSANNMCLLGQVAQSIAHPTADPGVMSLWRLIMK